MDHDSTDQPKAPRKPRRGSAAGFAARGPDFRRRRRSRDRRSPRRTTRRGCRKPPEEAAEAVAEGPLAVGHAAIENAVRLAPTSPGVYRMLNAANDVLYVGKAKNVRKRLSSYARSTRRCRRASCA